LGFFQGCLRNFHISHEAVTGADECHWTFLESMVSPSKWK
jgi:hypothetical protein